MPAGAAIGLRQAECLLLDFATAVGRPGNERHVATARQSEVALPPHPGVPGQRGLDELRCPPRVAAVRAELNAANAAVATVCDAGDEVVPRRKRWSGVIRSR